MLNKMHPKLAEIKEELKTLILAEYDDRADRIVIIGSAVADHFRENESDVDIVVLTNDKPRNNANNNLFTLQKIIAAKFAGPWKKIEVSPKSSKQVHLIGTNLPNCYEGQVLRGCVLYDNGIEFQGEILSKGDARNFVLNQYLFQAWTWIDGARHFVSGSTAYSACRSSCRGMHALLTGKDIDFASKAIRWNLMELCTIAEKAYPRLQLRQLVQMLPPDLAFIDFDDMPYEDERANQERRKLVAICMRVIRNCERVLIEDSHKVIFRTIRSRNGNNRFDLI